MVSDSTAAAPIHDLFVSYAQADRAWVEGSLLIALEQAGIRAHTRSGFAPGMPWLDEAESAVVKSRHVLLVISQAYLAAGPDDAIVAFTDRLARSLAVLEGRWAVIPLVLEEVELPPQLRMLVEIDAPELGGREAAIRHLVEWLNRPVVPVAAPPCPYPGMQAFDEDDAEHFFGRAGEVEELLLGLRARQDVEERLIAVLGPSGSGKSSLVFAGLLPALWSSRLLGDAGWTVLSLRPAEAPMSTPTIRIEQEDRTTGPSLEDLLSTPVSGRHLLVVDQFEQIFTITRAAAPDQAERLLGALKRLAATPDVFVVLTARADFYPDLMASSLWQLIAPNRFEILPLGDAGLREAIVLPAKQSGVYVEAALVERLVADAAGEPGMLPLVQETMVLLWERLERRYLSLASYQALAEHEGAGGAMRTGLQVAVARHADAVLARLDAGQREIATHIFLGLVQLNEGRSDTRRQRMSGELRSTEDDERAFQAVLDHLARSRLITLGGALEGRDRRVDLAHEALIGGWPWLRGLIARHRDAIHVKERLDDKVAEWVRRGRGKGGLLDAVELAEADAWLKSPDAAVLRYGTDLRTFVERSRDELAHQERRRRVLMVSLAAVAAVAIVAASVALVFSDRARDNQRIAEARANDAATAQAEALWQADVNQVQAIAALSSDQQRVGEDERGALLALYAKEWNDEIGGPADTQVDQALHATIGAPHFSTRLTGHSGEVFALAFSPDGNLLASGANDRSIRVWDLDDPASEPTVLRAPGQRVAALAFSPDGTLLAAGGSNGSVRIWDTGDPEWDHREFVALGVEASALEFIDQRVIITAGCDQRKLSTHPCDVGVVRAWNITDPRLPQRAWELSVPDTQIRAVAISPDRSLLAAGGCMEWFPATDFCVPEPTAITVWNLDTGEPPATLDGHDGGINALAFSRDGSTLISGSEDTTIRIWDAHELTFRTELNGHDEAVRSLLYSPDGSMIISGGQDETVRLWNTSMDNTPIAVLGGREEWVRALAVSADGRTLAATSTSNSVRLWRLRSPDGSAAPAILQGHRSREGREAWVFGLDFSPDGTRLASGSYNGTVILWPMNGSDALPVVLEHDESVMSVAWHPGGDTLASGTNDGFVHLWDIESMTQTTEPIEHGGDLISVAFSPDGETLASAGRNGDVLLWDADRLDEPIHEMETDSPIWGVCFSPDGALLATGHADGIVRVWDLTAPGSDPIELADHKRTVHAVTFNADGTLLASAGADGQVLLWDMGDPEEPSRRLVSHEGPVRSVAFSPDDTMLATGSEDATVRLWSLDSRTRPAVLGGEEEWVRALTFSPDGRTLASASADGTVRLWVPSPELLADRVCGLVGRNLTWGEWQRFVGESTYTPICADLPIGDGVPTQAVAPPDANDRVVQGSGG